MGVGKITIKKDRCKGCEYCIIYCPKNCIELSDDLNAKGVRYAVYKNDDCIACGMCARMCPDVCIEVYRKVGGEIYQKVGKTISKIIDSGLDKLRK